MKTKRFTIFLFFFALIVGCNKPEPVEQGPQPYEEFEQEFLRYWFFPEESYWVYEDKDSGLVDTAIVSYTDRKEDSHLFMGDADETEGPRYLLFITHSNLDLYGNSWEESRLGGYSVNREDWILFLNYTDFGPHDFYDNYIVFEYPYVDGDSVNLDTRILETKTLSLDAGDFEKTVHINVRILSFYDLDEGDYITDLYLAPDVGIVKYETARGYTMELIDYEIAQ